MTAISEQASAFRRVWLVLMIATRCVLRLTLRTSHAVSIVTVPSSWGTTMSPGFLTGAPPTGAAVSVPPCIQSHYTCTSRPQTRCNGGLPCPPSGAAHCIRRPHTTPWFCSWRPSLCLGDCGVNFTAQCRGNNLSGGELGHVPENHE